MLELLQEAPHANAGDWTDAELDAAVQAYLGMLHSELNGEPYSKAEVNRRLRAGQLSSRSKRSVELRMQNISAVLYELKFPWISGYLPAVNVGSGVKDRLISLLRVNGIDSLVAYVPTSDQVTLAANVSALRNRGLRKKPNGTLQPAVVTTVTTSFVRDPAVKAWVLQIAEGMCEGCGQTAPFAGQDGLPYLEVHHVMPLASHGSDTTTNAVALCPNCHRRCHYAADRDEFKLELYRRVSRLILEVPDQAFEMHEFIEADHRTS